MNRHEEHTATHDPLETALSGVAPRPRPPAAVEKAVYERALQDWKHLHAARRRKNRMVYWSLAASVLMALLISPLFLKIPGKPVENAPFGLVEAQSGSATLLRGSERVELGAGHAGSPLFPEQTLRTAANSGASIAWGHGNSIRVAQNTELHLNSSTEIELVKGKIYVDIPASHDGSPSQDALSVSTRFGSVSHVGTQFMVTSDASEMQVKVREGAVSIDNDKQVIITRKGQQTTVDDADRVGQANIPTYGPEWQWAEQLAPPLTLEGKTLNDFLVWVGRESGMAIQFETKTAEDIANGTVMHGSIDEDPLRALGLVLQTNELSWRAQDGNIYLSVMQ